MATSDYATLIFDIDAKPVYGTLHGFDDVHIEPYKNWLYIRSHKMWQNDCGFTKPTIGQINDGSIYIGGFHIFAKRHELQEAVFYIIETTRYPNKNDYTAKQTRRWCGISCCGYDDPLPRLLEVHGLTPEKQEQYNNFYIGWASQNCYDGNCEKGYIVLAGHKKDGGVDEFVLPDTPENDKFHAQWVGISPELYRAFITWLTDFTEDASEFAQWVEKIKAMQSNEVLIYNQGDEFFANNGVIDSEIGTPIDNPKTPAIMNLIGAV